MRKFKIRASKNVMRGKKIMASYDAYTENLGDFGFYEIEQLRDILDAWVTNGGLPEDFDDNGVKFAFNRNSGYVFLTNSDYQVAMLTSDGKLESWYYTPYSGHEGFYEDLIYDMDESWESEDIEYMRDIAEMRGDDEGIDKCNSLLGEVEE